MFLNKSFALLKIFYFELSHYYKNLLSNRTTTALDKSSNLLWRRKKSENIYTYDHITHASLWKPPTGERLNWLFCSSQPEHHTPARFHAHHTHTHACSACRAEQSTLNEERRIGANTNSHTFSLSHTHEKRQRESEEREMSSARVCVESVRVCVWEKEGISFE